MLKDRKRDTQALPPCSSQTSRPPVDPRTFNNKDKNTSVVQYHFIIIITGSISWLDYSTTSVNNYAICNSTFPTVTWLQPYLGYYMQTV